jgi:translation initiation factor 4E
METRMGPFIVSYHVAFLQVDGFWAIYSHLARLSDIAPGSEFFVFKSGIKPMWEVHFWF